MADAEAKALTINDLFSYLGVSIPGRDEGDGFPDWPPDLFAMCAAVLKKSGAYTTPLQRSGHSVYEDGRKHICEIAKAWRLALDKSEVKVWQSSDPALGDLRALWLTVWKPEHRTLELFKITDHPNLWRALIDLLAIADETCVGLGLPVVLSSAGERNASNFHEQAERVLFPKQFGSTLCKRIHPSIARVLPKMHTAQCGLTIRSFSHHLAFSESDEVRPYWISVPGSRGDARDIGRMNVLIAPWPEKLGPTQIHETRRSGVSSNRFDVEVKGSGGEVAARLAALAEAARELVGPIDAVILPELALTSEDHRMARAVLLRKGILTICGVGANKRSLNQLIIDVPISRYHALQLRQRKQHRWKLDESQIRQYHLGSRLNPEKRYWENIDVQDRRLQFVVMRPWLVTTALICEDLARHDPVGDLIRGVGPNLVIALLMDGPQISGRWPARYAAGLADDPGCSVLSITSLGMAELSRPKGVDTKKRRVIGLWKDTFSGATELEVPDGSQGVVITLTMHMREEKTADARSDGGSSSFPKLAGYYPVKLPERYPEVDKRLCEPETLSAFEASALALLAQKPVCPKDDATAGGLHPDFMPVELRAMEGSAFRIGREIWRCKTDGDKPRGLDRLAYIQQWASVEEESAAAEIIQWHEFNQRWHEFNQKQAQS